MVTNYKELKPYYAFMGNGGFHKTVLQSLPEEQPPNYGTMMEYGHTQMTAARQTQDVARKIELYQASIKQFQEAQRYREEHASLLDPTYRESFFLAQAYFEMAIAYSGVKDVKMTRESIDTCLSLCSQILSGEIVPLEDGIRGKAALLSAIVNHSIEQDEVALTLVRRAKGMFPPSSGGYLAAETLEQRVLNELNLS